MSLQAVQIGGEWCVFPPEPDMNSLLCKCGHELERHRDSSEEPKAEFLRYGRGICLACEACPVYRPHRIVEH